MHADGLLIQPLLEILAAMFMAAAGFLVFAEVITRSAVGRERARDERPGLGRLWWTQKQAEAAERARRR